MKKTFYIILCSLSVLASMQAASFPVTDSLKASKKWGTWLGKFNLEANDTIISLGSGSAWREFELSLLTNHLSFYLEDLDSVSLNTQAINQAKARFALERRSPLTNSFRLIYGTAASIPVKDAFADKVMIMNSYHHFDHKDTMLKEVYRVLNHHGRLIITDHVSLTESRESSYGCDRRYFLLTEKDLVDQIVRSNFKLISVTPMAKQTRVFVFEKAD